MTPDWKDHIPGWLRLSDKPFRAAGAQSAGRGHTKLNAKQAAELTHRVDAGESMRALARELQVTPQTVANTVGRVRGGGNG